MTPAPYRPVHTYSIVARDPESGEMGVAVQSHWFSVGSVVTWAKAGVGAVATQSFVDPAYGPRGLELMRGDTPAPDALQSLLRVDEEREVRQVAMVDAEGRLVAHTGRNCIEWAGHEIGKNHSAQANMMLNDRIVPAMSEAFEGARGPLPERLVAAIGAAEAAGGDIRGRQSAALLVVKGESSGRPWADRVVELRIEDHREPVEELRRLLNMHRAYQHMEAGDDAMARKEMERALQAYSDAAQLVPDSVEIVFWRAVTLATSGKLDDARPLFDQAFSSNENWKELLRRLPAAGLVSDELVARIL